MTKHFLDLLEDVSKDDMAGLRTAYESYGESWLKRGGVGAFMMLARKWDRIENALAPKATESDKVNTLDLAKALDGAVVMQDPYGVRLNPPGTPRAHAEILRRLLRPAYDIFAAIESDQRSEGIIDDIRDLRRYLMLVEARARIGGINPKHRDNPAPQVKVVVDFASTQGSH